MAEALKLPDDEFNVLAGLQIRFNELTKRYGELHYQKKGIEAELIIVDEMLDQLDSDRFEIVKKLQEKYGSGQVNLSTQEFIPDAPLTK